MKKIISKLFIVFALVFALICNSANALVNSDADIMYKINQLNMLKDQDFLNFINRAELIGNRLTSFNMSSEQYKANAGMAIDRLKNIMSREQVVMNSIDIPDTDKAMQVRSLYQEADSILSDIDAKTVAYIYSIKIFMPTITYRKYIKNFTNYYNSLNITGQKIQV